MVKMENVQRCVQNMMEINRTVETGRQKSEKIVRHVRQICDENVQKGERMEDYHIVEMERQKNERRVRIVQKMCENVMHIVEMEGWKLQKIVRTVQKM